MEYVDVSTFNSGATYRYAIEEIEAIERKARALKDRDRKGRSRRRKRKPTGKPRTFKEIVSRVRQTPMLNVGIKAMEEREAEFSDQAEMELAGIAMHEPARMYADAELDRIWAKRKLPLRAEEVVIGAGFHAAVYCAVRVAMGYPKPVVLEQARVGGVFALSNGPSFYLNSRNRPGSLGIPGREEALNVLPGGAIQPSQLSGDEYQRNSDLAWAIRTTLAMNAIVVTGFKMTLPYRASRILNPIEDANRPRRIRAGRLIYAMGLGKPKEPPMKHDRILTFEAFMQRMDAPFPLRAMERVAVVGAGDSGRTAIEALIGQGPSQGMSAAELDYVNRIDWYGVRAGFDRADWEGCNRSRYKGIARAFPRQQGLEARVNPLSENAVQVAGEYDGVIVNGRRYDHVIWCAGYNGQPRGLAGDPYSPPNGGRPIARAIGGYNNQYAVGPAAYLDMDEYEEDALPANLPENQVALFRYAQRTATLAQTLGGVPRYQYR